MNGAGGCSLLLYCDEQNGSEMQVQCTQDACLLATVRLSRRNLMAHYTETNEMKLGLYGNITLPTLHLNEFSALYTKQTSHIRCTLAIATLSRELQQLARLVLLLDYCCWHQKKHKQ